MIINPLEYKIIMIYFRISEKLNEIHIKIGIEIEIMSYNKQLYFLITNLIYKLKKVKKIKVKYCIKQIANWSIMDKILQADIWHILYIYRNNDMC